MASAVEVQADIAECDSILPLAGLAGYACDRLGAARGGAHLVPVIATQCFHAAYLGRYARRWPLSIEN